MFDEQGGEAALDGAVRDVLADSAGAKDDEVVLGGLHDVLFSCGRVRQGTLLLQGDEFCVRAAAGEQVGDGHVYGLIDGWRR